MGTGENAWNTPATAVHIKIGQILRIFNDDSVAHYLHTPGNPCPHGSRPFGPGQSYDCAIQSEADSVQTFLYDHDYGTDARFYVEATAKSSHFNI